MNSNKDQQLLADLKATAGENSTRIQEAYYFRGDAFTVLCASRDEAKKIAAKYPDRHTSIIDSTLTAGFWVNVYDYPPIKSAP